MRKFLFFAIILLSASGISTIHIHPTNTYANIISGTSADYLTDENGVLLKYRGTGASAVIPDGVTGIGERAFAGCENLKSVSIPESVTSIGACSFEGCSHLQKLDIPDSLSHIGPNAFLRCSRLTSLRLPSGIRQIFYSAGYFWGCKSLKNLHLDLTKGDKISVKIILSDGTSLKKPAITSGNKKTASVTSPHYQTDETGETTATVTITARQPGKSRILFQRTSRTNQKVLSVLKLTVRSQT